MTVERITGSSHSGERIRQGGSLEVITGCMFSGKTDELIRRLRRAKIARHQIQVFKPTVDTRYESEKVTSHAGAELDAQQVDSSSEILERVEDTTTIVAIDEAQFFDDQIVDVVGKLVRNNIKVMVAGLDTDFRHEPFGQMPALMAVAEKCDKINAICMVCGKEATRTQRLIDGKPANYNEPVVVVGASELYEARCRIHHDVPGKNGHL